MDISLQWIRDFTDIPSLPPAEISTRFTMATCEVEAVQEVGAYMEQVVASKVTDITAHPDADNLQIVTVDAGQAHHSVVCGAPNVHRGMLVPFAPVGTTLPGGFTLVPKKIRGVESQGMLCAEDELGLGTSHEGLLSLPEDTPPGTPLHSIYGVSRDVLLDIDNKSITHRPDLWGHFGMAREFAAVFNTPLQNPFTPEWCEELRQLGTGKAPVQLHVEEDSACKAYLGLSLSGIQISQSPQWMQQRLTNCGIRPINNIVDISNYVMLELGIPLHIFDRDHITDNTIRVERLKEEISFETLDGEIRSLKAGDTVVSDGEKPLVIAGIMGGANSGVTEDTETIFIEVANWKASEVRTTSARIGLRTDSSQRYEKSLDSQLLERTLLRTLELVRSQCPHAVVEGAIQKGGADLSTPYTPRVITVSTDKICAILGKEISRDHIAEILTKLDFSLKIEEDLFSITVPSYRATKDIECDADIIEEVGRIIGYDNIAPVPTYETIRPLRPATEIQFTRKLRDFLVLRGNLIETMTYPMIGRSLLEKADWHEKNESLTLKNALSRDHEIMRPSVVPSLLEMAGQNAKNFPRFSAFEIGRQYQNDKDNFSKEETVVTIALYDRNENRFIELRNLLEELIRYLAIPVTLNEPREKFPNALVHREWTGLHPYETLDIKTMGKNKGFLTTLHPLMARTFKIKGTLSMAVMSIQELQSLKPREKVRYTPLPKYPGSTFDCTLRTPHHTSADTVVRAVERLKIPHVISVKVADVFSLNDAEKAVTIQTSFLNPQGTLDHEFLETQQDKIVAELETAGFPLKV
ncbi:phenylalanine--tRNA ligase subunit beta [Chitinivibrio alkaliphilus]|uniref:Phenylalanine--tRNA ligase beta subunit n=1 Tax=Chitinivibrio alkaliphilus ACht1 TaxID=1313304 RepID=U7DDW8_9BACT|nr:phenylalanine--tRNA ligase subunit beta [Chitinivibrio alkaliphilus]ERP39096.1 phenylalanyl-tRNA synthetase beta chain [Chitinivibrio alkaliphilus ACht1]